MLCLGEQCGEVAPLRFAADQAASGAGMPGSQNPATRRDAGVAGAPVR
jgi:hypothetical protein